MPAACDLLLVASGRARRMFSSTLPWKRCGLWGTSARFLRQDSAGRSVISTPLARIALIRIDEAHQQVDQRALARTAAPDERGPAPRGQESVRSSAAPLPGYV